LAPGGLTNNRPRRFLRSGKFLSRQRTPNKAKRLNVIRTTNTNEAGSPRRASLEVYDLGGQLEVLNVMKFQKCQVDFDTARVFTDAHRGLPQTPWGASDQVCEVCGPGARRGTETRPGTPGWTVGQKRGVPCGERNVHVAAASGFY
jgi:hypothetical protein